MVNRGEIWWAELAEPIKSQPGFRRPVLVIQSDTFNQSKISTVICAVITSNLRLSEAPGNVLLPARASGLSKDSVINVSQIITVDKSFLTEKIGELNQKLINKLEEGLKLVLSL
ncbi:MAG: type II toxin-antitoxin system PemK/MazF family toxin [Deltaproteobacteria bacterium]|nr:type II toxin-antitoxin system PemK/MazF family toxin [Deltaproteobacteria bacterium]